MSNKTLYKSYQAYFSSVNAPSCQPMSIEYFQHFWMSCSESEREFWAKKFRIGFAEVVAAEATFYRNAFEKQTISAKAA